MPYRGGGGGLGKGGLREFLPSNVWYFITHRLDFVRFLNIILDIQHHILLIDRPNILHGKYM